MPINTDISDLSWLTQAPDPGGSLTRGVAAGSQIANSRAQRSQVRLQEAGLAQRAMEFEREMALREEQLSAELRMLPLKQAVAGQEAEMNGLKIEEMLKQRQATLENESAYQGLAGKVAEQLPVDPVAAEAAIWEAISQNKGLYRHPGIPSLLQDARAGIGAKLELKRLEGASQSFMPEEILVPSSIPGQPPLRVLRKGPNTSEVVNTEEDALRKRALELQAQRLEKQLPDEAKAELKSLYKEIDRKKEQLDQLPLRSGMVWNRVDNPKRAALQSEIDKLREKAAQLSKGASPTPPPSATQAPSAPAGAFEVGKTYIDANGNRAIYRGDGNWTPLP